MEIAIEDVVVAGRVYELARAGGLGRQIPLWQKEARFRRSARRVAVEFCFEAYARTRGGVLRALPVGAVSCLREAAPVRNCSKSESFFSWCPPPRGNRRNAPVLFDGGLQRRIQRFIQILERSSLWIYSSRIFTPSKMPVQFLAQLKRARKSLDFTAGIESPRASAVSSVDILRCREVEKRFEMMGPIRRWCSIESRRAPTVCTAPQATDPQSSTSRAISSSPVSTSSSSETWLGRRLRNFISAWLTAMRTSQV